MANTSVQYRVRPVTRYIVTRHEWQTSDDGLCGSCGATTEKGEFDNARIAFEVGTALAKDEHQRLGYPPDDPRVQYPERVEAAVIGLGGYEGIEVGQQVASAAKQSEVAARAQRLQSGLRGPSKRFT